MVMLILLLETWYKVDDNLERELVQLNHNNNYNDFDWQCFNKNHQKVDDNLERELEQLKTSQGLLGQTSQQMGEQVSIVLIVLVVLVMIIIMFLSILVDHDGDDQPADENGRAASWYYYPNDDDEQHSSFTLRARCGRWVVLFLHQVRGLLFAAGEKFYNCGKWEVCFCT